MSTLRLSRKLDIIEPSASLQVTQRALELKREGRDIISLSIGEPDFAVPFPVKEGLHQAIDNNLTHYTESQGVLDLRRELAKYIGHSIEAEQILFCSGCKFGIHLTLEALLNPGDEVIIIEPAWVSYEHMVTISHGKSVKVKTREENNFLPTAGDIQKAVTEKTKALILNNPNNPSGQVIPRDLLDEIVGLARENDLYILGDEIYSDIVFEGTDFYSLINYDYDQIIILSGFSKNFAMTGLRLGYIIAKKEITKAILKLHQHTGTCAPSIVQHSLIGRLPEVFEKDVKKMREIYERRRDLLVEGLKDTPFPFIVPQATFYLLLNISPLGMKSLEASKYLLEEAGVATVPGISFGDSIDDYVRVSFATSEEQLNKFIQRLKDLDI